MHSSIYLRILPWIQAVKTAEKTGDLQGLVDLLRSDAKIEPTTRKLLAELLSRGVLRKKKGGQRKPIFELTAEQRLANSEDNVRRMMSGDHVPIQKVVKHLIPERDGRIILSPANMLRVEALHKLRRGMTEDEAIAQEANDSGLSPKVLKNFMNNKVGFGRSKKK